MLDFSGEIARRERPEAALAQLHRELRAVDACHQTLMRAVDEANLLSEICRIVCEEAGYRMAWVGYVERDGERLVRPVARAGHDDSYVDAARVSWANSERGRGPIGAAVRSGKVVCIQDYAFDPRVAPWRDEAVRRGYNASVALPLKNEAGEAFGVLSVYAGERDVFTAEEVRLLERLAADLAFGVLVLRQRDARKRMEALLQANLRFFEGMDRVNSAIRETADIDAMLGRVLELTLELTGCDRAWLLSPCDPQAPSWRVRTERVRLEFAAASLGALDCDIPTTPEARGMQAAVLAATGPVAFGPAGEQPNPDALRLHFGVQSQLAMAIRPKTGRSYGFGLHQCSHARAWSVDDRRLFEAIGRRLEDALTSLHAHNDLRESESQLRTLIRTIPDVVWVKDLAGRYLLCNAPFERVLGIREDEAIGKTDYDFAPAALADRYRAGDRRAIENGETHSETFESVSPDGAVRLFEVLKAPLRDERDRIIGVVGVARDISERHAADAELRIAATAFEAQEGIVILDADQRILRVNRAFAEMMGHSAEAMIGRTPQQVARDPRAGELFSDVAERVERDGFWRGEMPAQRASGEIFPAWTTVAKVRGVRGETTHYVATLTDATERKRAEKEIVNLAYYDGLTGLPNRRLLLDRLEQALAGSARNRRKGALLFIDLDNFKLLNETSGHEVGDHLLVEVARRLDACLGASGGAARVGGDEFVALVEDLSENPRDAAALAKETGERILAALNAPYALAGGVRHSSPSIGVAMFGGGDTCEEVFKQADIAMYEAKAAGRNALRFFDPDMQATLAARAESEAALRLAIREQRFVLHYQPQVDCDGEWIGAEALLRWAHPERGLVAPGEFIPLAEETGLILPIGRWVLETACQQLEAWSGDRRSRDLHLSVNVSARQFGQPDFVEQVAETLRATSAPAERLVLELTESVVLDDIAGAADKMSALKQLGVGFAVDDFGTGYSSLAYLIRLPLDQIKIDRSFVRNLPGSANDAAVAHTIITLAESLGLTVIAEGVETEAQRRFLERHGCPSFQGFLFGKPMPIAEFEAKLD